MALIHCNFKSRVLDLATAMCVALPQEDDGDAGTVRTGPDGTCPTLWLLHGLSDDHTIWQRRTSIERYAEAAGLAVVMPAAGRSFYADMARGLPYWTFLTDELPRVARSLFPLSAAREANFVAGLSMGGYGAFKWALSHPEQFAAAASLSGALNVVTVPERLGPDGRPEIENIFGRPDRLAGSAHDLMHLAERLAALDRPRPALYTWCGTEDFLYEDSVRFRDHARGLGLDLVYEEGPGEHEWASWDRQIQRVLDWLPVGPRARAART
jgi:S-formylglutathione hydrolase FrmB